MKLFSSFKKELKIALRGYYFYIELFIALLVVGILLFLVPDNFNRQSTEYLYLDMPPQVQQIYFQEMAKEDFDGKAEAITLKINQEEKKAALYESDEKEIYILTSRDDLEYIADKERELAAVTIMDKDYQFNYDYYLQGYESSKFKNLLSILHAESPDSIQEVLNGQEVRSLSENPKILTDKENMLPTILVFNGALMGLFIIAAYIFLDKQEGVIKAYALTPSPVWQYLLSKVGVVMVSSILSTFIILLPIMKFQPNYLLLMILLLTSAFFSSSLGLLIASFYENITQAFGTIYVFLLLMILPSIAYFIPSWNPSWLKFIPSYPILEGFKSILLGSNDWTYILSISSGFLVIGLILFMGSNARYKKYLVD